MYRENSAKNRQQVQQFCSFLILYLFAFIMGAWPPLTNHFKGKQMSCGVCVRADALVQSVARRAERFLARYEVWTVS